MEVTISNQQFVADVHTSMMKMNQISAALSPNTVKQTLEIEPSVLALGGKYVRQTLLVRITYRITLDD
jgi:hypothetical protein